MRLKAINVLGYESEEQIQRHKALMRMGLCEEDIYLSAPFFRSHDKLERLRQLYRKRGYSEKLLDLLGMTEEQILRRKALTMLGTTEQEIEDDRVRRLVAGRSLAATCWMRKGELSEGRPARAWPPGATRSPPA
jgi:hypothetical protein